MPLRVVPSSTGLPSKRQRPEAGLTKEKHVILYRKKWVLGGVVLNQSPLEKSESSEWGWFLSELLGW